jgi:DNA-binding MarR family transcriptional regulator
MAAYRGITEAELISLILEDVYALSAALSRVGQVIARGEKQTYARWQVLNAAAAGDKTVSQLARQLGVTRQAVKRMADDLAKKRLVSYRDNPGHRRSAFVILTPEGRRVLRRLANRSRHFREHLAKRTTRRGLAELRQSVRELSDAVIEAEPREDIVPR